MSGDIGTIASLAAIGAATGGVGIPASAGAGGTIFSAGNIALASGVLGGASTLISGVSAAQAASVEAANARLQASQEATELAFRDEQRQRALNAAIASQRAAAGAAGISFGIGTPSLLAAKDASLAARERARDIQSSSLRQSILKSNARSARSDAKLSLAGGIFGAGAKVGGAVARKIETKVPTGDS